METADPKAVLLGLLRLGSGLPSPLDWTAEEEARWSRMKDSKRAAQYRAGRWLLRRLCALATGREDSGLSLNADGAPRASGPAGVDLPHLSLSHSGDWVAATACGLPAGVDLERLGARRDWALLGRELGLNPPHDEASVLRAWTLREAGIKAGGTRGLRVWRFGTPDYCACLLAPPDAKPELKCFGDGVLDPPELRVE